MIMHFNVGENLRVERKKLNLSQKEFVRNVISVAQYSRVESGKQDIRCEDLMNILVLNQISINNFFANIERQISVSDTGLIENYIFDELTRAFYERDVNKLVKLQEQTKDLNVGSSLKLRIKMSIAVLNNKIEDITESDEKEFLGELSKTEDWTNDKYFLQLFGTAMMAIDNEETVYIYMLKIIDAHKKYIAQESVDIQKRIAGVCINFLATSYLKNRYKLIDDVIDLLNNLSQHPELLMYKLLGKYFRYLFTNDEEKKNQILKLLDNLGYQDFISNLPK